MEIAQRYCVQVDYQLRGKNYYAIGFENRASGYELRNPFFKGSTPPKDITHFDNNHTRCNVFEGFIDFLSAEKLRFNDLCDVVVLNSVSNIGKALPVLTQYSLIACYLDNDDAGRMTLSKIQKEYGDKVVDFSRHYPDHKDLNENLMWMCPKKTNKYKLKF